MLLCYQATPFTLKATITRLLNFVSDFKHQVKQLFVDLIFYYNDPKFKMILEGIGIRNRENFESYI